MVRAEEDTIKAFQTGPGYRILLFLEACLKEQDKACRMTDAPEVYRAQGAALELEAIVTLAKTARGN